MHITIRQLQVFEAVARRLSYTRAAEELHLTQPAVSMQVKQLEGSVGLPLFEQMGKKIQDILGGGMGDMGGGAPPPPGMGDDMGGGEGPPLPPGA